MSLNYSVHLSIAFIFMLRCTSGNTVCSMVLWDKGTIGVNLEVLIFCHHVHVLYIHGYLLIFSFSLSLSLSCRDPKWGCLCWPEQIPVPCGHHPLAWHYQEPRGWAAGGTIQQQQPRMWVLHMGQKPVEPVTLVEINVFWHLLWPVKAKLQRPWVSSESSSYLNCILSCVSD